MYATEKKLNNTPFEDTIEVAEDIWQATKNAGGATFVHDTVCRDWSEYQGDGYAVGGYQDTVTVDLAAGDASPVYAIARFIERIPITGDGSKRYLLGTWIESGVLYIDAVQIWAEEDDALNEARKNGEKAIFHFNTCETIYVEPEVELAPLDGILTTIVEEGAVFVRLDDVIAELENLKGSFFRLQQEFAKGAGEGEKLNAAQFGAYVNCVEWQVVPALKSRFVK